MVLADFALISRRRKKSSSCTGSRMSWHRMSLMNIAGSGVFCADRAVEEYAQRIWRLTK